MPSGIISFRRAKTTLDPMKPNSTSSLVRNLQVHAESDFAPGFVVYINRFPREYPAYGAKVQRRVSCIRSRGTSRGKGSIEDLIGVVLAGAFLILALAGFKRNLWVRFLSGEAFRILAGGIKS